MTADDVLQVIEVERDSFPTMWPPTAFTRELRNNIAHYLVVVEHNPDAETRRPAPSSPATTPSPRPFGWLLDELRQFLWTTQSQALPPIEERPELIAGFIGGWLLPDEIHIVTFGVRQSHRRSGIGEALLIAAIELARHHGRDLVTLECRVSNEAALALYDKYAFEKVGLRPRYYSDNREDAFLLTASSVLSDRYHTDFEALKAAHQRRFGEFAREEWDDE